MWGRSTKQRRAAGRRRNKYSVYYMGVKFTPWQLEALRWLIAQTNKHSTWLLRY